MAPTATDIPSKYDVILDGQGFRFWDASPDGTKAEYGFTPAFVPRSNTQGDYGDNFQDFWMTATQRDWTLGQYQRFYRPSVEMSTSRYWDGDTIEHRRDGEVKLGRTRDSVSFTESVTQITTQGLGGTFYAVGQTKLFSVNQLSVTDLGAHGAGAVGVANGRSVVVYDGHDVYIAGATALRKYTGSFASFSAAAYRAIAFLNNTLYALKTVSPYSLVKFDTAGTATVVYTWQDADGTGFGASDQFDHLVAYGSKLLIVRANGDRGVSSLWIYDGAGVSQIAEFPSSFSAFCTEVVGGVIYVGGLIYNGVTLQQAIYYYAFGTLGLLWTGEPAALATTGATNQVNLAGFAGGLAFADEVRGRMLWYSPDTGGISDIGSFTPESNGYVRLAGGGVNLIMSRNSATAYAFTGAIATTGSVTSSLFDFDSSLTKIMRGVKVEFDAGTDGNGGTVDIAYRVGDVGGSYTSLQTTAVSGTEYTLTNITGRSISVKVTLNKGTSTWGPTLKRVSVRAVPQQPTFRREQYVLDLSGRDGQHSQMLRDGITFDPKDGMQKATDLRTAATSSTPITIIDRFGTFTGVIEADGFRLVEVRPEEFYAVVKVREI